MRASARSIGSGRGSGSKRNAACASEDFPVGPVGRKRRFVWRPGKVSDAWRWLSWAFLRSDDIMTVFGHDVILERNSDGPSHLFSPSIWARSDKGVLNLPETAIRNAAM